MFIKFERIDFVPFETKRRVLLVFFKYIARKNIL
jgi:hypothetical protein